MSYTQTGRRLSVTTPLGKDFLLLAGFTGHEAISRPFSFQLQCIAENSKKVPFESILGQRVTVEVSLPGGDKRWFNGICLRVAQGGRDATFTSYVLDLVPAAFLLSRKTQSRIFQHKTIPDILKEVLKGVDGLVVTWEIQGTFEPRDYCVQYRESDFAFASRLMEEEGIYYFFKHSDGDHKMVVTNKSQPDVSPGKCNLIFDAVSGGTREEDRVHAWEKMQELRSSKVMLWDHCFELPHKPLDAPAPIQTSVAAGKSSHKLQIAANAPLELYDFPGAYAQRFDGIQPGGGDRPADIQKIFEDKGRTAQLRIEEQATASVLVHGASNCRQLVSGHKFTLERHFEGDGPWVLYEIDHLATEAADVRSGRGGFSYQNHFSCFPVGLPFRPPRVTPIPTVRGTQTAVVVGPAGEEIFTDKYGRIKVQFHWDRERKNNAESSCWVRVATPWAGKKWGAVHIPRIGQEVVVDFLEGDMDQPIVIGSVYNAECMPPYELPANKTQSGVKSRSSLGGSSANFNEIRFEDKKGHEQLFIHAEKNQDIEVENDETHWVGHDRTKTIDHDETTHVKHDRTEVVDNNESISIGSNRTETVGKNETITIGENRTETVGTNESISVGGNRSTAVGGNESVSVGGGRTTNVGKDDSHQIAANSTTQVGKNDEVQVGKKFALIAGDQIQFQTGDASIIMKKDGTITISGKDIKISGSGKITVKADSDVVMKGSKISQN